jgi:hypothetical protein
MAAKHPDIRVTLNAAGDDFRIIDHVIKALRRAGVPAEEIETFCDEAMSGETASCFEPAGDGWRWRGTDPDHALKLQKPSITLRTGKLEAAWIERCAA